MTINELYSRFLSSSGACTDTRKITPNCLFFALTGDKFNGNTFAASALEQGAAYAVIDQEQYALENGNTILVDDALTTLQQLAKHHRQQLGIPVIALTGSNGKTTTKELIYSVLSQQYKVTTTQGNLNNHIGVPLTLLAMNSQTQLGLVEMGANHQKEIDFLCTLALPDYGYITNYGKAHLEGFGGVEGVIKGKSELYKHLDAHNKTCFVNGNDPIQMEQSEGMKRILFNGNFNDTPIEITTTNPFVSLKLGKIAINSHLLGDYNAKNIIAALCMGHYFKVSLEACKAGIESYVPSNNRSQWHKTKRNNLLLDAYNANPSSMQVALENFAQRSTDKPATVILGDMFELGDTAAQEHQAIANLASRLNFNTIFLVGENFYTVKHGPGIKKCREFEDLLVAIQQINVAGHNILIKGSRGMALERIVDYL